MGCQTVSCVLVQQSFYTGDRLQTSPAHTGQPTVLRERAIAIAHEGHQGLVKTKKLLREKVCFPGIDNMVKQKIEKCIACQANGSESRPDPLHMSPLLPKPWHTVNMDFSGPLPTGESLLIL